ncbi:hypothetical protein KEJ33_05055 [Candidatus Bathyarchaeota archaeon]|nr:hypothetical protein [Candidatus Bathyarchaeota archaeon]
MAELLRAGATMTNLSCPACSSPLFRLKNNDLWCASCQKKVIVVKDNEQIGDVQSFSSIGNVESTLLAKIIEINSRIQKEEDLNQLEKLNSVLSSLLDNLDKAKKILQKHTVS